MPEGGNAAHFDSCEAASILLDSAVEANGPQLNRLLFWAAALGGATLAARRPRLSEPRSFLIRTLKVEIKTLTLLTASSQCGIIRPQWGKVVNCGEGAKRQNPCSNF